MTRIQAFNHLLDNKDNGLGADKRKVWRFRFGNDELSERLVIAELRNFGYKENAPDNWIIL